MTDDLIIIDRQNDFIQLSGKLDCENEMTIYSSSEVVTITKEDAIRLVEHLQISFKMKEE